MESPPEYSEVMKASEKYPKILGDSPPSYDSSISNLKGENGLDFGNETGENRVGSSFCKSYCGRMLLCVCGSVTGLMSIIVIFLMLFYFLIKVDDDKVLSSYCFTRLQNITEGYMRVSSFVLKIEH